MPTLGAWVLNSLPGTDALAAGRAGSVSPGKLQGSRGRDGTPASVRVHSVVPGRTVLDSCPVVRVELLALALNNLLASCLPISPAADGRQQTAGSPCDFGLLRPLQVGSEVLGEAFKVADALATASKRRVRVLACCHSLPQYVETQCTLRRGDKRGQWHHCLRDLHTIKHVALSLRLFCCRYVARQTSPA